MFFENTPYKGNYFLNTYDNDNHLVIPTYSKGGS